MELCVWFRRPFSVRDVHWQKWVEKSGRDEKMRMRPKGFFSLGYARETKRTVLDLMSYELPVITNMIPSETAIAMVVPLS